MTQTNFISAQNLISQTGWTNINAILLNNGTYAVSTPTTGLVSEFTVGNFLFNVPTGSLVSGLEFEFNAYRGITSLPSTTLELWAYDNTNSNNAWYQLTPVFTDLHLSASTFVLGGTTYTFNQNLTSDQVNNLKFKVIVNDEVYLGAFKVRVTYSEPVNSVTTSSSVCTTLLQAQPFKLLRPISATDTTCIVDKFKTSDGVDITTANLPVMGYPATIDPLTPKEENIKVLAVTVLSGDTRELTITRGWSFRDPDGQSPSLAKSHGLAELVLSNNFQYEQDKLRMCQIGSLVSEPITVFDEGGFIAKPVSAFDFVGSGVSVSQIADPLSLNGGKKAIVTINGTQPNTPNGNGGSTGTSGNTQVTNITYNTHSVSGTDRFTIISVSLESTATVTGITVGASLATFLGSSVQAGVRTEAWYVINTPLGINPVSVTTSSAVYLSSSQYTWNGVDQTLPIVLGSSSGANTNTSTGTGTTTVINSLLLHIIGTHQPSITYTAGSGENILSQTLTGQMQTAIQQQIVGTPSTQTSNIALSQITNWANIIASVNPTPVSVVTGQTNIQFQDEGSNLGTTGTVDTVNITGTGATASRVGNTVTINVPGGVGSDEQVKVSATDTTTGYLDNKIELVNGANTTVTKTILNPGANEKIQYQVNTTVGSGYSTSFDFTGINLNRFNFGFGNFDASTLTMLGQRGDDTNATYVGGLGQMYKKNSYGFYSILYSPSGGSGNLPTFAILNNSYAGLEVVGTTGPGAGFTITYRIKFYDLLTGSLIGTSSNLTTSTLFTDSPGAYYILQYTSIGDRMYVLLSGNGFTPTTNSCFMLVLDTDGTSNITLVSENPFNCAAASNGTFYSILKYSTSNNNFLFKGDNKVYDFTTGSVVQTLTADITNNFSSGSGYIRYSNDTFAAFDPRVSQLSGPYLSNVQVFDFNTTPII